jgi:hypothetical protein
MFDGKAFGQEVVEAVKAHLGRVVEPLLSRIEALEKRLTALPVPRDGQDGKDGRDGRDPDPAEIQRMVDEAVARMPVPKDGRDGKDADAETVAATLRDQLERMVAEAVDRAVAALPSPRDGRDADPEQIRAAVAREVREAVAAIPAPKDGTSVSPDEVAQMVATQVQKAVEAMPKPRDGAGVAGALIDRKGSLVLTLSDGKVKDLGPVVGRDVDPVEVERMVAKAVDAIPRPRDAFGFDDLTVEHDGERNIVLRFVRGDQTKEFPLTVPVVLDRGVWREGEYQKGDAVTWGGSLWIAQEKTSEKPETGAGWRLAVKRGRDGKDGTAPKAAPGPIRVAPVAGA